jgi:hypothetical protein
MKQAANRNGFLLDREDRDNMFLRYVVLAYTGLHSIISQEMEFFVANRSESLKSSAFKRL